MPRLTWGNVEVFVRMLGMDDCGRFTAPVRQRHRTGPHGPSPPCRNPPHGSGWMGSIPTYISFQPLVQAGTNYPPTAVGGIEEFFYSDRRSLELRIHQLPLVVLKSSFGLTVVGWN